MAKLLAWISAIILGVVVFGWGLIFFIGFESYRIQPNSLPSILLIPKELREIKLLAQCGLLHHTRDLQECGGICGEFVGVSFGTTATLQELNAAYTFADMRKDHEYDEINIYLGSGHPDDPENCKRAQIVFYDDYARDPAPK